MTRDDGTDFFPYAFEGEIVHHHLGTMRYTAVFLPDELAATLPFGDSPRLRATGEIADVSFAAAWQPSRGRWYMMLSKRLLKDAELAVGDVAAVRFRIEPSETVDDQPDISRLMASDEALSAAWTALPPGRRRGWVHRVLTAKTAQTRTKRLGELATALTGGPDPFRRTGRS